MVKLLILSSWSRYINYVALLMLYTHDWNRNVIYLSGAVVRIECRSRVTSKITYQKETVTNSKGHYTVLVETDCGDDYCDAVLVKSSEPKCSEPSKGRDRARVILTRNNGMCSSTRYANAMGFLASEPLPSCGSILQKYQEAEEDWRSYESDVIW